MNSRDATCAGLATLVMGLSTPAFAEVCGASSNDCCSPSSNHTPYCQDSSCCSAVCALDSYCCTVEWDVFCSNAAYQICPSCSPPQECGVGTNDCCVASANGTPFCKVQECCLAVCEIDASCCNDAWDALCATQAQSVCIVCGADKACGISVNDCCEPSNYFRPYCNDEECCTVVCAVDPACCTDVWDWMCAYSASFECKPCGPGCVGDFFLDGVINGADLGVFLGNWGMTAPNGADFDGSGTVDGADLGLFLGSWGPCD